LLQTAIDEAFSMAQNALNALNGQPIDDNVQRLVNLLFGQNADTSQARRTFTGIVGVSMKTEDPAVENEEEVVRLPELLPLSLPF
jgi:hypothetical protein